MIPVNIIVTAKERSESWLARLAEINPHHQICFFDDKAARDLVKKHFPGDTLAAYDKVRPGAYRADLFRYCALQVMGGIYSDSMIPYSLSFSEMWDLDRDVVYLILDKGERAIQVGTMACNRGSRFMQLCRERSTRNILANYYGDSPLAITGPKLAWSCFEEYTGVSTPRPGRRYEALEKFDPPVEINYRIKRAHGDYRKMMAEAIFVDAEGKELFPYKLNRFRGHRKNRDYYWKAWHRRAVYGERVFDLRALACKFRRLFGQ